MPELEMLPGSELLSPSLDNLRKTPSPRGIIQGFRGLLWCLVFEALAVLVIAITWALWHLLRRSMP